ncbi:MAG: ABC transporter ATP-binding protein [Hyphomicrobiaceae bacterium]|nr:ABC transporter ATP-binding protein [Hyphomicrobiaceae bacterium]
MGQAAIPRTTQSNRPGWSAEGRPLLRRFASDWILPRWRTIALALCWTAGVAASSSGYPAIIKHSFDSLRQPGDSASAALPWVLLGIVGITACRGLFLYLYQTTATRVATRMVTDVQKAAFAHLMNADFARLTRETTGRLVARMTSDLTAVSAASQAVLVSARDTFTVVAMVSVMFYYDWAMTLVVLCGGPLAALPVHRLSLRLRSVARRTQRELGSTTSRLTETFSGARLIKSFRLERYVVRRLNENFEQVLRLRLKAVRARAGVLSLLEVLGGIAVASTIAFAFWRITSGINTEGDFVAYVACIVIAAQSLRSLGSVSNATSEGLAAAERIYELLDEKPAVVDRPSARPLAVKTASIVFDNVSFAYAADARTPALRDLSMNVAGGEMVALVGRSGAGKSTIVNLVPRLFDVSAGAILIDGQDIRDVTLASLREAIAMVSQEITLFDDTIRANIALGRLGAGQEDIIAAAKAAAAHDFIMAQPDGYDTVIGEGGLRLSGGQRQRLALARAFLKDAPILLLDEATSALDTESEGLVQAALARFTRNRTTLVIAHRLSTVQRASMICVMDEGRLAEVGTHAELLARNGIYAKLCRSQALLDLGGGPIHDSALTAPAPPTAAA